MNTKMRTVVLNDRGQVVIPEELRRDLSLSAGETLVILEVGEQLILTKEKAVIDEIKETRFWRAFANAALESGWSKDDEAWEKFAPR